MLTDRPANETARGLMRHGGRVNTARVACRPVLGVLYGDLRGILYLEGRCMANNAGWLCGGGLGHLLAKSRALDTRLVGQRCHCEQAPSSRLGIRVRPSTSHSTAVLVFHLTSHIWGIFFSPSSDWPHCVSSLGCVLSYHKR